VRYRAAVGHARTRAQVARVRVYSK